MLKGCRTAPRAALPVPIRHVTELASQGAHFLPSPLTHSFICSFIYCSHTHTHTHTHTCSNTHARTHRLAHSLLSPQSTLLARFSGPSFAREEWNSDCDTASRIDQHALWTNCLARHVSEATVRGIATTVVDYIAINADPVSSFDVSSCGVAAQRLHFLVAHVINS